jgi:hypothetical protein
MKEVKGQHYSGLVAKFDKKEKMTWNTVKIGGQEKYI